jgi:HSP20 family protein
MMERMLDEAFVVPLSYDGLREGTPAIDLFQNDEEVVVKASLPGVKPEDIDVSITGEMLSIRGEVREERTNGSGPRRILLQERAYGSYSRVIRLPTPVNADKAKAKYENGVLTLRIPKADEARPKTIAVKAK